MNPVLYWNDVLLEASRRDFTRGFNNAQQPGPIRTARAMAIVHIALHDVIAFRTGNGASAYLNKKGVAHGVVAPNGGSFDGQMAGAAMTTLKALYPNFTQFFDDSLGAVNAGDFAYGVAVGNAVLAHRANDGSNTMLTRGQPSSPAYGQHRADPFQPGQSQLGPVWGNVTRFLGAAHKPLADFPGRGTPDYLANADYRADFDEVRDLGAVGRGARTAEQQRIGVYWGYDGANNLGVPPRLYNQIARRVAADRNLILAQTAELFAIVNVAMADAGIDAWHYKYTNDLWRPVVGVRQEDATEGGDPFWAPLGAPQTNVPGRSTFTPNFPAYPSGHATFGAALFQALRLTLKTAPAPISVADVLAVESGGAAAVAGETFNFVSDELDGIASDPDGSVRTKVDKQFTSFAEAVWENSVSRIYLGVHWRFDGIPRDAAQNVGGVPLGLAIGQEAHSFFNTLPSLAGSA
ncbi:vanadium-dependent haloperoxidase [Glacieibacterium frigidum]|uniref:Vanadium-dependent haloperoxidase n=1 Tax=Glacieibacterium frigidum TaxID=2593303 RepID=A0A552UFW9_9SPHN|nr:vanadium-dependent haloperoxidase [Glacieibacterium frigidum]TRW17115.1 vanadium-dependent haloperoxidase [Glacieibacterium frigidum]